MSPPLKPGETRDLGDIKAVVPGERRLIAVGGKLGGALRGGRGELFDEFLVLGARQPSPDQIQNGCQLSPDHGCRIEPEARENMAAMMPFSSGLSRTNSPREA